MYHIGYQRFTPNEIKVTGSLMVLLVVSSAVRVVVVATSKSYLAYVNSQPIIRAL